MGRSSLQAESRSAAEAAKRREDFIGWRFMFFLEKLEFLEKLD